MNPFKSYTYTWWQIGIFKLAMGVIGVAIGAYWHQFFGGILVPLIAIAVVASVYIGYVSMKQK